jgi:osmotically inducible protein OsmC
MPRIVRNADVTWEGNVARGNGTIAAGTGAFDLPFSLPTRIGEAQGKTSPEELLAAAHAGCFSMSLAGELAGRDHTPERVEVKATVTMDEVPGKGHLIVRSELDAVVTAPGLDEAVLAEAAQAADEGCPFSALIRASAEVAVSARLR